VWLSSDVDTNSTKESDSQYNQEPNLDVDKYIVDDVDVLYTVDLDGKVNMSRDCDNKEEDDE
jgi:hypothetical protein